MEQRVDLARTGSGARPQREARASRRRVGILSRGWAIVLGLALLVSGSLALATKYVYDDNGRLVVMVNEQSGESARYVYDKVGNLLKIERLAAGQVAVFSFVPARGATGVAVTIQGQGFSTTASDNAVRFNGVAATVTSSSLTELKVTVPAGASTGPLTVTVGTQTVSGPADFVVDEDAQPPQITSVSPMIGVAGTQVTVSGQRLYPAPDLTRVLLGDRIAVPGTSSQTQLTFPVPVRAGSGKITVSTPYGSAQSADEFVVVPAGVTVADVVNGGRLNLDAAPRVMTTAQDNQTLALLLDSNGRDLTSLQFGDLAGSVSYSLYAPDNRLLISNSVSATAPSAHLPRLGAGLHLLLLKPSAPMAWSLGWEKNATLSPQAEPLAVATATAYQSKRYVIDVAAGDNLGVGLSDLLTPGSTSSVQAAVYRPDGSQLTYDYCYASTGGCDLNLPSLSIPGPYTLVLTPTSDGQRLLSLKATLSADLVLPLGADAPASLALSRRGQNGRLTFTAQAGSTYAFNVASQTTEPANRDVYYTVYKPDGSVLQQGNTKAGLTLNLARLPASGGYQIYVDPYYGETATVQLGLVSGETGEVLPGQGSGEFATATPGQNVYFGFTAEQGANLGLGISDLSTPGTTSSVYVYVYRPDGTQLAYEYCYFEYGGCDLNFSNLPAGNYSVVVIPPDSGERTVAFKATLSADLAVALTADTAVPITLDRRGQNARLTFAAQAGQTRAFNVSAQTTVPATRDVYYTVYKPDGTLLQQGNTRAALTLNLPNLPATGNYLVFMDPGQGEAATAQIKLVSGVVGGPDPGGSLGEFETQTPGQNVYFSFPAKQGDHLGLGLSDLVTPGTTSSVTAYVYGPDGTRLSYEYCYASDSGCDLNLTIPADGTYNVTVVPPASGAQTMAFKATLSADQAATLAINAPFNLDLTKRGENARLSFAGEAGQTFALTATGRTVVPAGRYIYYTIYQPDGALLQQGYSDVGVTMNLRSLPATGNYLLFVDPLYGETAKAQLTLLPGETGEVQAGSEPRNFATQVAGQNVYFSFKAEQGANLGLALSDLSTPGSTSSVAIYVYRPDGTRIAYDYCYASDNGCELNLSDLSAGDYTVMVTPPSGGTAMSFKAVLSADLAATLSVNTPIALVLDRRGQNARIKFAAEAGQTLAFNVADQISEPAGRNVYYTVYKPDGALLQQGYTSNWLTMNLAELPVSGDYLVFVDPQYGEKVRARLTLISGESQTIAPNGDPGSVLTQAAGQSAFFTFTAAQGANLGLGITDLVTPGTTSSIMVNIYSPDGNRWGYQYCYASEGGCGINLYDLAAGTYRVVINAPSGGSGTMSFNAVLSEDLVATLTPGVEFNLALTRRGQNARLSFNAQAGETYVFNASQQQTTPTGRYAYYTVYQPNGSVVEQGLTTDGTTLNLSNLPVTGKYLVYVDPRYGETLSARTLLAPGVVSQVAAGAQSQNVSTQVTGQTAYLSFTATQGANLGLGLADLVTPGTTSSIMVNIYSPDGNRWGYQYCYASEGGCGINLYGLAAGTYRVVINAPSGGSGTMSFNAVLSEDLAATLTPGVEFNLALTRRGQNARLSFNAQAGETYVFNASQQQTTPTGRYAYYTVYQPNGSVVEQGLTTDGTTLNLSNLPVTGKYLVYVDPRYGETLSARTLLAPGVVSQVEAGAQSQNVSTQVTGQTAYLSFTATQGANLGLGLADLVTPGTTSSIMVNVYSPDGNRWGYQYCYASEGGCGINLYGLAAGTYRVVINAPSGGSGTMSFNAVLSEDLAATLTPGVEFNLALTRRGQNARLSFDAQAGETFVFNASQQQTTPSGRYVYYTVYQPNGSVVEQGLTTDGTTLNLSNLPVTGKYLVYVDPRYGETLSARTLLAPGVVSQVETGAQSQNVSTQVTGQTAYLSFTATQGANLGLGLADLVTPGTTSSIMVNVYSPDGNRWGYQYCYASEGGCGINLYGLAAGTYRVVINAPSGGSGTMSFNAVLSEDLAATLTPGVEFNLALSRRGQNARLSFDAQAGETFVFNASQQQTTPSGRYVYYTVYQPNGSVVNQGLTTDGTTLNLSNLPVTGKYLVYVDPRYGEALTVRALLTSSGTSQAQAAARTGDSAPQLAGKDIRNLFIGAKHDCESVDFKRFDLNCEKVQPADGPGEA
ncbi:IPT/TIG domain-containing protein [Lysobacter enzymogenes]|uniref:IPT/TIG domain-containing protein n=1 Tax=Lysobacter enzymogenes TaxID=69 RepID=UPI00384DCE58